VSHQPTLEQQVTATGEGARRRGVRRSILARGHLELLGTLTVVASLVFVGVEIRQNSAAMRAAATQQLGQSWIDWNVAMASRDIQQALVLVAQFDDPSQAPAVEQRMAESVARSLFSNWSISDYQHRAGVLDMPLWDGVKRDMAEAGDTSHAFGRLLTWAWARNRYLYTAEFTALMDSVVAAGAGR
jgi:hypothetical protein